MEMADDKWGAGDPSKWSDHGTVMIGQQRYPLIYGEHPHSRRDNQHYVKVNERGDTVGFDGHRILIDVQITSSNYMKESHLSGDEVRKGGAGKIFADGVQVYEFFHRDPQWACLRAYHLIGVLEEHSSGWLSKRERDRLVGRKIFFERTPAVITRLIEDQGCIIIATADGKLFPPPVYARDGEDYERESEIKDDVLSRNIWWHRD
jgi:hypothetical protein